MRVLGEFIPLLSEEPTGAPHGQLGGSHLSATTKFPVCPSWHGLDNRYTCTRPERWMGVWTKELLLLSISCTFLWLAAVYEAIAQYGNRVSL